MAGLFRTPFPPLWLVCSEPPSSIMTGSFRTPFLHWLVCSEPPSSIMTGLFRTPFRHYDWSVQNPLPPLWLVYFEQSAYIMTGLFRTPFLHYDWFILNSLPTLWLVCLEPPSSIMTGLFWTVCLHHSDWFIHLLHYQPLISQIWLFNWCLMLELSLNRWCTLVSQELTTMQLSMYSEPYFWTNLTPRLQPSSPGIMQCSWIMCWWWWCVCVCMCVCDFMGRETFFDLTYGGEGDQQFLGYGDVTSLHC